MASFGVWRPRLWFFCPLRESLAKSRRRFVRHSPVRHYCCTAPPCAYTYPSIHLSVCPRTCPFFHRSSSIYLIQLSRHISIHMQRRLVYQHMQRREIHVAAKKPARLPLSILVFPVPVLRCYVLAFLILVYLLWSSMLPPAPFRCWRESRSVVFESILFLNENQKGVLAMKD
ncbi:uncharacterized protein J3D65DRAFT_92521 [Phyllosticta citribraziliensis]|uniref:Transmembrane protein n=1 Tax=Phyllosticta citribraziliensis TaxID=989973 RepID=A0ABR1LA31_9PEZI